MAGVIGQPAIKELHRYEEQLGYCWRCRARISFRGEKLDFAWVEVVGLMCDCRACLVTEYDNPLSRPASVDEHLSRHFHRLRFRLRMLAWQWQTGRTLAGYWRGR